MDESDSSALSTRLTKSLTVKNDMGIHARPAAMIVRIANRYRADLYVEKDDEVVDGKSIMGLMMLAAGNGSVLKFTAEGEGAEQVLADMETLFKDGFNEG
jgi:phosphocarrier protein